MILIDIHTHRQTTGASADEIFFYNHIVGKEGELTTETGGLNSRCSAGIHPWYIHDEGSAQLQILQEMALQPTVCMIGEAGIDKLSTTPLPLQVKLFEAQAALAEAVRKPMVIHCVKAWQELLEVHRRIRPTLPWLIHGFRGKGDLARQLIRKGFYLSFGLHFHSEAVQSAWPDRLFAETDEAVGTIAAVYQQLATAVGYTPSELAAQTEQNLKSFLKRDETDENR